MSKQTFESKCDALKNLLEHTCDTYILVIKGKEDTCIAVHGVMPDLLFMTNELCATLRKNIVDTFHSEEAADRIMQSVLMTTEEIEERAKEFVKENKLPKWLRKLMELEDEEDDSTDEADSEEEDEQDDDDGDTPDITVRVDVHHHDGDDDNE